MLKKTSDETSLSLSQHEDRVPVSIVYGLILTVCLYESW